MTDEPAVGDGVETPDDDGSRTARRPSPAAAAASRARRIGGGSARPNSPGASPKETESAARPVDARPSEAAAASSAPRTSLTKTGRATPSEPSGDQAARAARPATEVPGWLRWVPAGVLTAAALVMAVFFAVESHGVWWARPSSNAVRDQVLAAAKSCTVAANSYSYRSFAADESKGLACTTGAQTQRYRRAMETVIKPQATKLKATQTAQVNAAGVSQISQDGSQWTILVFGQLSVHGVQTSSKGRIDPFAAVVRMDHVGGKWLISSIATVSAPAG